MKRSKLALGHTSTYGQACAQCYKAKCRCLRLRKRCEPSESLRRRNVQTAAAEASDTRIARLEDKMESLLSAMQSFIGSSESSVNALQPPQVLTADGVSSFTSYSDSTVVNPTSTSLGGVSTFVTDPTATIPPSPNSLFLSHPYSPSPSFPLPNHGDERLNFFRSRMLPAFPIISLTPGMTSSYLRQNRPLLLQAIHTVTTFSTKERQTQVEELKHVLFTSALVRVQSNIDLLLGLLTYLAWSTDAFLGRADLLSRLMMLAISLAYDLRLFKPPSPDVQVMMTMTQGGVDENTQSPNNDMPEVELENHRALHISSHLGRQDAIRWAPAMGKALQVITANSSSLGDELFTLQVRLQRLKQRADDIRQQDDTDSGTGTVAASAPRFLYLKALRRQLHELRSSFRAEHPKIDILNTHAQYVELYMNQLGYSVNYDARPLSLPGGRGEGGIFLGLERFECLWQSVENIKSWLEHFYNIPCSKLVGQPFHFWSQMMLNITLLKYLSTLKDPEWDCQAVQNTVDLMSTMDRMCQKLDRSSKDLEHHCNDHLLGLLSKLLQRCRGWFDAQWKSASRIQAMATTPDTHGQSQHIPDLDQMVWMQSMDLGNEQWFEDVLRMPTPF